MLIIDAELLAISSVHALVVKLKDGREAEVTATYNYDENTAYDHVEVEILNEGIFSWTEREEIRNFVESSYRHR